MLDVKHQDGRQNYVGEASSTTSQDNPSHHDPLTEGEEEKIEDRENAPRVEGVNGVVVEGNSAVPVEREFINGSEFGGKFDHDETERKSYDGGSSGSSSSSNSSSDDESHGDKNSCAAIDTVPTVAIVEAIEAVVDCVPPVVSDKVSPLSESLEVNTSSPFVSKENGEKKGSVEEQVGGSETFYDAEATTPSVEYVEAASDLKALVEETDERLSLLYNAPIATHDNGADLVKDSGVTEPLLVPPPRPVKMTSWKGCCGLFELFTGSDR